MTVSAATAARLQRTDDTGGVLTLLKIEHPSLSGPLRVVSDTRNLDSNGETFIGIPFQVKLPTDADKETPRAQLRMDNVGREMTAELEKLPPGAALQATLMVVHRATPDVVDYQFTASLVGVHIDSGLLTASISTGDLMRRPAVAIRFDPVTAPGLFPD